MRRAGWRARTTPRLRVVAGLLLAALVGVPAGCGGSSLDPPHAGSSTDRASGSPSGSPAGHSGVPDAHLAMDHPGAFEPPIQTPDLLVFSRDPLPADVVTRVRSVKGVEATELFSMASFYVEERAVTYAAVNPASFRRFTPAQTAQSTEVWDRIADGELGLRPTLRQAVAVSGDTVSIGNAKDAPHVHVGAYAPFSPDIFVPYIDAVLNARWADRLHMPKGNAMLVSTGSTSPQKVQRVLRPLVGRQASLQILGPNLDTSTVQTAIVTGGTIASAVGSFTYTVNKDGSVNPDPAWVREYIRTEQVPIIGAVRCNKVIFPQLRAALKEIVQRGLADKIHPKEYGGCYVPRFIGHDPRQGLSFHTWGTAIDLNVPGNQRGTVGLMDRTVVSIFDKWGFNWGGRWHYTDPMHFELARIVKVR